MITICYKINGIFRLWIAKFIIIFPRCPSACDQPYTQKRHGTPPHELPSILARGTFKVTIQDGRTKNDRESKHDELNWYNLRGIKSLKSSVYVFDLHDSSANQDRD